MIRNIRNRFPAHRWMSVVGWTTVTMAWITAIVARTVAAAPVETPLPVPDQDPPAALQSVPAAAPVLPGQGLIVLRSTPSPVPEPEVIVVSAPAAGAPSPAASVSSGS